MNTIEVETKALSGLSRSLVLKSIYVLTVTAVASVSFSVALSSITMGAAILLWMFMVLQSRGGAFVRTNLDWLFLAYAAAEVLAGIFSVEPGSSFYNMKRLFLLTVVYLVVSSIGSEQRLKIAVGFIAGIAALFSLIEIFSLTSVGGHFARVSLFQHFLTEGGIKMIVLLLVLPFVIHPSTPKSWRIMSSLICVPLFIGLVLTQTRSSWLGLIGGILTIGIIKNRKLLLFLLLLIVLFLLFAPQDFRSRAASIIDPTMTSNLTRIHMISTGWKMFLDRPWAGWGDIDLRVYYVTYITPLDDAEGGHLHNNIMQLLVTLGIIGFMIVVWIFVMILRLELSAARSTFSHWLYGSITLGCLAAYIGFQINGLFEWNFGDHEIAVLLWFTVGFALAAERLHHIATK